MRARLAAWFRRLCRGTPGAHASGYPGGPDSPSWRHEFAFASPAHMTPELPQRPTAALRRWLASVPSGPWGFVYEMGELWGVGFAHPTDAAAFRRDWGGAP